MLSAPRFAHLSALILDRTTDQLRVKQEVRRRAGNGAESFAGVEQGGGHLQVVGFLSFRKPSVDFGQKFFRAHFSEAPLWQAGLPSLSEVGLDLK